MSAVCFSQSEIKVILVLLDISEAPRSMACGRVGLMRMNPVPGHLHSHYRTFVLPSRDWLTGRLVGDRQLASFPALCVVGRLVR